MHETLLFLDSETGGTDSQTSDMLTVAMAAWHKGQITATTEFFIKKEIYRVSAGALKVNKINLVEHHNSKKAIWEGDVFNVIDSFIALHVNKMTPNERTMQRVTPVVMAGHRVQFDVDYLKTLYKRRNWRYGTHFQRNTVDTAQLLELLHSVGILPKNISDFGKAVKHFGIEVQGLHTAIGDIVATAQLYNICLELVKGRLG